MQSAALARPPVYRLCHQVICKYRMLTDMCAHCYTNHQLDFSDIVPQVCLKLTFFLTYSDIQKKTKEQLRVSRVGLATIEIVFATDGRKHFLYFTVYVALIETIRDQCALGDGQ